MKTDVSVPRNPVLAKLFRIAKFCESAGYGFDKMLVWKKETHKDVLFETSIDRTKITFMLKDGKLDSPDSDETTKKQPENKSKILTALKSNPIISRSEMAKQLGISEGSLRHHLEKMKRDGLIKREGSDKGGKWVVIE